MRNVLKKNQVVYITKRENVLLVMNHSILVMENVLSRDVSGLTKMDVTSVSILSV